MKKTPDNGNSLLHSCYLYWGVVAVHSNLLGGVAPEVAIWVEWAKIECCVGDGLELGCGWQIVGQRKRTKNLRIFDVIGRALFVHLLLRPGVLLLAATPN